MLQAFIVVLREGVEALLIVAITLAYLRKTTQNRLVQAVLWGIIGSIALSAGLGYFLWQTEGANQPLWEGFFGLATVILVVSLTVHMWRQGPQMKTHMEKRLTKVTSESNASASYWGVFIFTLVMISREGMETALLLFQIQDSQLVTGALLGILGAAVVGYFWQQFGFLINLKHFFQVTAVYFLLFTIQIAVQAFHEFTEAGVFPNSEALHIASEPYSMEGRYGQFFQMVTYALCAVWLIGAWATERFKKKPAPVVTFQPESSQT
jgi:high-affinity iron transporter